MDIVGFYLPPDSGERVSFKITLLLGYSVFLIIVSDTLPATAIGTPLIGDLDLSLLISGLFRQKDHFRLSENSIFLLIDVEIKKKKKKNSKKVSKLWSEESSEQNWAAITLQVKHVGTDCWGHNMFWECTQTQALISVFLRSGD